MQELDKNIILENRLITSQYNLDICERAIFYSVLANIDQSKEIDFNIDFTLRAVDYAKTRGISTSLAYRQLKESVISLYNKEFTYKEFDEKGKVTKHRVRFVQDISYSEENGQVTLQFANKILPFLFALKEKYTTLKLLEIGSLKSVYSSKLFELLSSEKFKGKGTFEIAVSDLVELMQSNPNLKYNMFKERILNVAIRELGSLDKKLVNISFKEKKERAKVVGLIFYYKFLT